MSETIPSETIPPETPDVVDKETLKISHKNDDLRIKLQRDMRKWKATLAKGNQTDAKILALKKTLLLLGSSGMEITGGVEKETISASGNKLPIAEYLSGHMGRVYLGLPEKGAAKTLKWISGEGKVMKPRFAATHAAEVVYSENKKEVKEKKLGFFQAAASGVFSKLKSTFSSTPRVHNGIDVAMGGQGNILESARNENPEVGTIRDNGTCGHVYFNANSGKNGDSLGIGLEGTAPGKTGYLGSHSIFGSADEFSALEGEKFAVKFNKKTLASYLENKEMKILGEQGNEAVKKLKKHLDYKKPFFKKLGFFFRKEEEEALLSKEDLTETCKAAGIVFVGGGKQMLTRLGKQCLEAGITPQDNYGGAKMVVKGETLKDIMAINDSDIPNEIIYFKPQNSPQCFIAQKPIYEGIESKPVLRDNPQFSHETSVAIGTFYNSANSRSNSDDEGAKIIRETIGLIDKDKLGILGIDINNFDVLKDFEKLTSSLDSFSAKDLDSRLGITVGKEALMASLEQMKKVATAIAEAEEGKFSDKGEYLKLENETFGTKRVDSLQDSGMVVNDKVDKEADKQPNINEKSWVSRVMKSIVRSSNEESKPGIKTESNSL
jgi:hypothetical protein